jgi:diacylglycerol kinase family enzyme
MMTASHPETAPNSVRIAASPDADRRAVLISLNPRAGRRSCHARVESIRESLTHSGYSVRVSPDLAELAALAAEGLQAGDVRAVIAVGGDGTASVVRNHVPLEVPMVHVPMGTENLLGRYMGQATQPGDVCRTIREGVVVGLDLGSANGKHFLLMISAGFDAEVVRTLHENRRGNISRLAYVGPTLRTIRSYGYPQMRLYSEDAAGQALECRWLFGFNLPLYAFGLPIAPDANATDGKLDLCAFERGNIGSVFRYLWHVRLGVHSRLADTTMLRSSRFRLEAPPETTIAYQVDGDWGGTLPVDVEIFPGQLRMMVQRETALRLGFHVH